MEGNYHHIQLLHNRNRGFGGEEEEEEVTKTKKRINKEEKHIYLIVPRLSFHGAKYKRRRLTSLVGQ